MRDGDHQRRHRGGKKQGSVRSLHDVPFRSLRLEKRRGAFRRFEPLVILENDGQLFAEPDTARLVVESPVPVQLQIVREVEGRQRGGHREVREANRVTTA